jgi:hypothetical protein
MDEKTDTGKTAPEEKTESPEPARVEAPQKEAGEGPAEPSPGEQPPVPPPPEEPAAKVVFEGPDAAEKQRILERWLRLKRREAIRKARAEKWKKRWARIRIIFVLPLGKVRDAFRGLKSALLSPWQNLLIRLEAAREAREAKKREALKKTEPERELAARKRWEAWMRKEIVREERRKIWAARFSRAKRFVPHPRRWLKNLKKRIKAVITRPYYDVLASLEEAKERRDAKKRLAREETRELEEVIIQKRYVKLVEKERRKSKRREQRKARWKRVRARLRPILEFWENTFGLRKLLFLIILGVLGWRYRETILAYIESVLGLQLH